MATLTLCELAMITRVQLEGVLGGSLMNTLCFNVILEAMEDSPMLSKLAPSQRETIARGAHTVELAPNAVLDQAQVRSVRHSIRAQFHRSKKNT